MDYKGHSEERERKRAWIEAHQERIDKLAEDVLDRMDMSDLLVFAKDALEGGWSDYPDEFEIEWKEYQENGGE